MPQLWLWLVKVGRKLRSWHIPALFIFIFIALLAIAFGVDHGRGFWLNFLTEAAGLVAAIMIAVLWIDRRERQEQERTRKAIIEELKRWRNYGWVMVANAWQFLDPNLRPNHGLEQPAIGFDRALRNHWQDVVKTLDRPLQAGVDGPALCLGGFVRLAEIRNRLGWSRELTGSIERSIRLYAPSLQAFPEILRMADRFLDLSRNFSMQVSQLEQQADRNKELLLEASVSGRIDPPVDPQDHWVRDPVVTPDVIDNYRQTAKAALHLVHLCEREIGEWTPPSQLSQSVFGFTQGVELYLPKDYWPKRLYGKYWQTGIR